MSTAARRSVYVTSRGQRVEAGRGERRGQLPDMEDAPRPRANEGVGHKARVYIAAENRLLREALSRMLLRSGEIEVVGLNSTEPFRAEGLSEEKRIFCC